MKGRGVRTELYLQMLRENRIVVVLWQFSALTVRSHRFTFQFDLKFKGWHIFTGLIPDNNWQDEHVCGSERSAALTGQKTQWHSNKNKKLKMEKIKRFWAARSAFGCRHVSLFAALSRRTKNKFIEIQRNEQKPSLCVFMCSFKNLFLSVFLHLCVQERD